MKRETSWTTAILLSIAAMFGLSQRSEGPGPSFTPPAGHSKPPVKTKTPKLNGKRGKIAPPHASDPCEKIEERLRAFYPVKDLASPVSFVYPSVCYSTKEDVYRHLTAKGLEPQQREDSIFFKTVQSPLHPTKFVIATLPDPEKTHLTLIFDRLIVAIGNAASQECLTYDSSWMPWRSHQPAYTGLKDEEDAEQEHEDEVRQPGVLLFRASSDCEGGLSDTRIVVFVVGETPTGGIDKQQFLSAIAWIQSLSGAAHSAPSSPLALNILGPISSGSFDSLQHLLALVKGAFSVNISTGTANAGSLIDSFKQQPAIHVNELADFEEDDRAVLGRFLCGLDRDGKGYDIGRVATLSEDETAFGASLLPSKGAPSHCDPRQPHPGLFLTYPRDISSLRSEYQRASLLSPSANDSKAAVLRVLPTSILEEEEGNQSDTVASYSGKQQPLSEEAELLEVVDVLRSKQIEFIVLRGSNPMDEIFLAQFLRRAYPEGRIVLEKPDALLFRGRGQDSLNGVLTLSVYPLTSELQDWTDKRDQSHPASSQYHHAVFTDVAAEGEYNAARHLLHRALGHTTHSFELPGYATPDWMFEKHQPNPDRDIPPIWLSIIAANRVWPIDAYPFVPDSVDSNKKSLLHRLWFEQADPLDRGEPPGPASSNTLPPVCTLTPPSGFIVVAFIPLCFALWQLYRRWRLAGAIGPRQQAFISLEWSCIAVMAIVPAVFAGLPWELLHGACQSATNLIYLSAPLAFVSLIAVAFPIADVLIWPDDYVNKTPRTYLAATWPLAVSIVVFAICWLLVASLLPAHRELMFWRGLSPLSGVSPSAAFIAFAIGWFLFCVCTQMPCACCAWIGHDSRC